MNKLLLSSVLLSSTLFAQTTMCFKQNVTDITTIETVKLNGGDCNGAYSLTEMKKDGWIVNDIKITPNQNGTQNFLYILKKGENYTNFSNYNNQISQEEIEQNIMKKLVEKKKQDKLKRQKELLMASIANGEALYSSCVSCHGAKGEKPAYAVSKPLNTLSARDMYLAVSSYTRDSSYGYGYQTVMIPYAASLTESKVKDIKAYLDSINSSSNNPKAK